MRHPTRSTAATASPTAIAIGLVLAIVLPAAAQDIPKRKSGLWEISMDNSAARA